MTKVKKKNGRVEPFIPEKISVSVRKAMIDAGDIDEDKKDVIDLVAKNAIKDAQKKKTITAVEIRNRILRDIEEIDRSVSEAWMEYEKKNKSINLQK